MTPAQHAHSTAQRVWWLTVIAISWASLSMVFIVVSMLDDGGHHVSETSFAAENQVASSVILASGKWQQLFGIASVLGLGLLLSMTYGLQRAMRSQIDLIEDTNQVILYKEQKLQEGETRFQAIFHSTYQLIGLLTPDGVVRQANTAALKFLGKQESELIGLLFWDTPFWNYDSELQQKCKDAVAAARQGEHIRFQVTCPDHQGKMHLFDFSLKPVIDDAGDVIFLIPEGHDITELKTTQDVLSELLHTMQLQKGALDAAAGVSITDAAGKITYVNRKFCETCGYSEQEILGQTHHLVSSGLHPQMFWNQMWSVTTHGEIWHGEICNRTRNGELYWVDTTIMPSRDESGKITQYVAVHADITERKNAETRLQESIIENRQSRSLLEMYTQQLLNQNEALEQAQAKAEAANATKSEFLANMSHEIRTPMTAILGYADLLSEDQGTAETSKQRQEYIETIKRHGEHLLTIINDILDLSKIEAGKMTVEQVPTNTVAIINDVVKLLKVRAKGKALGLECDFTSSMPAIIQTDPTRLRQILLNLAGNAIKFTETGKVTITANVDTSRPGHAIVSIAVRDTGIGLDREQQERLFGAFQQADNSMTRRFGGTGLGLRISRRLAEMLNGDIVVKSELGKGSEFTLTLDVGDVSQVPLIDVTNQGSSSPTVNAPKPAITTSLANLRILFAEDGPDNQRLIAFILRKAGASVTVVDNGKLAVEKLTADGTVHGPLLDPPPFDLVLSDMAMPEMDGYEAARCLRDKGCTLPIVALTAHSMAGDREQCMEAGCTAYASKPIDKNQLLKTIAEVMANREPTTLASPAECQQV